ncbi:hypothetical protein VSU19_00205 [Verrucomicrobiales bacterium BCK34]|nr:hypothetical protein [Verrucomicrobiales bacterium BCK34]
MAEVPTRKNLPHDIPHWVDRDSAWFITINCDPPGKPQLSHRDPTPHPIADAVLSAARFYHEMPDPKWFIHLFLVMPDHIHAVMTFPRGCEMKPLFKAWKGYVKRNSKVMWQDDFFDHRLRSEESKQEKLTYIRMNPVRQNFCKSPGEWPHLISFDPRTGDEYSE